MDIFGAFENRTLRFKLIAVFLSVILIPMFVLAAVSYKVLDARLMREASERLSMGLKFAWTEYYVRGEQMRYGMLQAAASDEIRAAVATHNPGYLKKMFLQWKQSRPYVDIWAMTDPGGRVLARLNSDFKGDVLEIGGTVSEAMAKKEPVISTELLEKDVLGYEGSGFVKNGTHVENTPLDRAMAIVVVTPILDESRRTIGAIITADILNGDDSVPERISYKNPGLFSTITMGKTRIATNLADSNGRHLEGTDIPDDVYRDLGSGAVLAREWSAPGLTSISLFEPIRNRRGEVIGALDVGISKEGLWAVQKENQRVIALITLLGLSVSLFAALVSTYRITKPVRALRDRIMDFAAGDMNARVEITPGTKTNDEIKTLGISFNAMMDEVAKREGEKGRYLKEIERKNDELAALNEELRITNEELEVAYEETQSQTEELHAINEELKLLNEDLDRKNAELQKANRTIIEEEDELKRAKDKLRLIYDSITDYILLVGYDHKIFEANKNFMNRFKLTEALAVGKNVYNIFGIEPPQRNCPIKKSIDTMLPIEAEMTTPDGKVLTMHCFPMQENATRRAVVYVKDITEQKLLTQKLIQTDKLSSLGELVSGVAHELNNPLTGIMCFSELLMDENLAEPVKTKLRKINDATHRCKRIIDNLLTFARWKRPEKRYESLNKVIKESVELRAYQLKVDNIEVELDLGEDLPFTMLDENQINQVFLNLINNARDAIKDKGDGGRIRISSRHSGRMLVASVEDTGKGMTDDVAGRIFDPFFTTKGVGKGTGLGLSISYGIINEHGGNIYASSKLGSGTTFIIELPVIDKHSRDNGASAPESEPVKVKIKGAGLKVLVLDDEPIVLELVNETLAASGFQVESFSSGEEALARLKETDYDLIISDIKMPGLDGKAFFRELKNIKEGSCARIIFITGDSVNKETQDFLAETGNVSLRKPFTVDELNSAVAKFLNGR